MCCSVLKPSRVALDWRIPLSPTTDTSLTPHTLDCTGMEAARWCLQGKTKSEEIHNRYTCWCSKSPTPVTASQSPFFAPGGVLAVYSIFCFSLHFTASSSAVCKKKKFNILTGLGQLSQFLLHCLFHSNCHFDISLSVGIDSLKKHIILVSMWWSVDFPCIPSAALCKQITMHGYFIHAEFLYQFV